MPSDRTAHGYERGGDVKLVVGLGNPDRKYQNTRHNIGFDVADVLCRRHGAQLQGKFKGEIGRAIIVGSPCLILKPLTYMNRSGISVALVREYFQIDPSEIVVIHDEVDLSFGRLRIKSGGGHAGHNGIRSIKTSLGTGEFDRLRVGVGRPQHGELADFVLSSWSTDEKISLTELLDRCADAVEEILQNGPVTAMNRFNAPES